MWPTWLQGTIYRYFTVLYCTSISWICGQHDCRAPYTGILLYYTVLQSPKYVTLITAGHFLQVLYCIMLYFNRLNMWPHDCRTLSPGTLLYYTVLQSPEYVAHMTAVHYLQVLYCTILYFNHLNRWPTWLQGTIHRYFTVVYCTSITWICDPRNCRSLSPGTLLYYAVLQ